MYEFNLEIDTCWGLPYFEIKLVSLRSLVAKFIFPSLILMIKENRIHHFRYIFIIARTANNCVLACVLKDKYY